MQPAAASPLPPATTTRRVTRAEIVSLGQSRRPWEFLGVAVQALRATPEDHAIRLLAAANFAALGLATAAREQFALVPESVRGMPEFSDLGRVIATLPDDRISPDARRAQCAANLKALGEASELPPSLRLAYSAWSSRTDSEEWCRASDGNVIWRTPGGPGVWSGLGDFRTGAAALPQRLAEATDRPVYMEGLRPPWAVLAVLASRPPRADGYVPRTWVVQADPREALDGLALADLSAFAPCVRLCVGPEASHELGEHLRRGARYDIAGPAMSLGSVGTRCSPPLIDVVSSAEASQQAETDALHARVTAAYAGRDAAWWRERYARAAAVGPPLRVLIPTTRFSTFIRHASEDLAAALVRAGHEARVLIEPDASTRLAAPSYLACFDGWEPDLIVHINFPRALVGPALPTNVPHVCWIQDAMPHLFQDRVGAGLGPLDFVVGYAFDELFSKHGYPRSRASAFHITASEAKFHDSPITPAQRTRLACDLAYASHQSEAPDAQHARLRAMFESKMGLGRAIDALRPIVEAEATKPLADLHHALIRDVARDEIRRVLSREPGDGVIDAVYKAYCQPHADRLIRHQTLAWAANACRRRGWRLKLFGQGWERHPTLAEFASGPLEHGDDLRASYQAARAHLHMTGQSLVHQRVMECLLSGGFPLCRFNAAERWALLTWHIQQARALGLTPSRVLAPGEEFPRGGLAFAQRSLGRLGGVLRALGVAGDVLRPDPKDPGAWMFDYSVVYGDPMPPGQLDQWSLVEALGGAAEFFFCSASQLEERLGRLIEAPSAGDPREVAALKVRSQYTYRTAVDRILGLVRTSLEASRS